MANRPPRPHCRHPSGRVHVRQQSIRTATMAFHGVSRSAPRPVPRESRPGVRKRLEPLRRRPRIAPPAPGGREISSRRARWPRLRILAAESMRRSILRAGFRPSWLAPVETSRVRIHAGAESGWRSERGVAAGDIGFQRDAMPAIGILDVLQANLGLTPRPLEIDLHQRGFVGVIEFQGVECTFQADPGPPQIAVSAGIGELTEPDPSLLAGSPRAFDPDRGAVVAFPQKRVSEVDPPIFVGSSRSICPYRGSVLDGRIRAQPAHVGNFVTDLHRAARRTGEARGRHPGPGGHRPGTAGKSDAQDEPKRTGRPHGSDLCAWRSSRRSPRRPPRGGTCGRKVATSVQATGERFMTGNLQSPWGGATLEGDRPGGIPYKRSRKVPDRRQPTALPPKRE